MLDTLKTAGAGVSGLAITWLEWLPIVVRILVGMATFFYLCLKIYKLYSK